MATITMLVTTTALLLLLHTNVMAVDPSAVLQCAKPRPARTPCMTAAGYDAIASDVAILVDTLEAHTPCLADDCPLADFAGCVLRLAGHDFMDGATDGCVDFEDPDNAGLINCMNHEWHSPELGDDAFTVSLQSVYGHHCGDVSVADFIVIAAEAVMSRLSSQPGGIDFRANFNYGRTTPASCESRPNGTLPNPEKSCDDVERVFNRGLGLSWEQTAALMGVHTLGKARPENSGYDGYWSDPQNSKTFNNDYFTSMVAKGWVPERAVGGNPNKNQWVRKDAHDPSHKEMMLNTDLCLLYKHTNNPGAAGSQAEFLDAATHSCCAWLSGNALGGNASACGSSFGQCCGDNAFGPPASSALPDCEAVPGGHAVAADGPAAAHVVRFASDEGAWLGVFQEAWFIATNNLAGHALEQLAETCDAPPPAARCADGTGLVDVISDPAKLTLAAGCPRDLGVVGGAGVLLLLLVCGCACLCRRRAAKKQEQVKGPQEMPPGWMPGMHAVAYIA